MVSFLCFNQFNNFWSKFTKRRFSRCEENSHCMMYFTDKELVARIAELNLHRMRLETGKCLSVATLTHILCFALIALK